MFFCHIFVQFLYFLDESFIFFFNFFFFFIIFFFYFNIFGIIWQRIKTSGTKGIDDALGLPKIKARIGVIKGVLINRDVDVPEAD